MSFPSSSLPLVETYSHRCCLLSLHWCELFFCLLLFTFHSSVCSSFLSPVILASSHCPPPQLMISADSDIVVGLWPAAAVCSLIAWLSVCLRVCSVFNPPGSNDQPSAVDSGQSRSEQGGLIHFLCCICIFPSLLFCFLPPSFLLTLFIFPHALYYSISFPFSAFLSFICFLFHTLRHLAPFCCLSILFILVLFSFLHISISHRYSLPFLHLSSCLPPLTLLLSLFLSPILSFSFTLNLIIYPVHSPLSPSFLLPFVPSLTLLPFLSFIYILSLLLSIFHLSATISFSSIELHFPQSPLFKSPVSLSLSASSLLPPLVWVMAAQLHMVLVM